MQTCHRFSIRFWQWYLAEEIWNYDLKFKTISSFVITLSLCLILSLSLSFFFSFFLFLPFCMSVCFSVPISLSLSLFRSVLSLRLSVSFYVSLCNRSIVGTLIFKCFKRAFVCSASFEGGMVSLGSPAITMLSPVCIKIQTWLNPLFLIILLLQHKDDT